MHKSICDRVDQTALAVSPPLHMPNKKGKKRKFDSVLREGATVELRDDIPTLDRNLSATSRYDP